MNRRNFVKAAAGTFFIASAGRVFGAAAPSNAIRLAIVGCSRSSYSKEKRRYALDPKGPRGRGFQVMREAVKVPGCEVAAVCDVDSSATAFAAEQVKAWTGKEPKRYFDFRDMLADPDIDAVVVATPDHWHVLAGCWTMQAKKALYLEKPIGVTAGEAEILAACQRKTGMIFQLGTQRRSSYACQQAIAVIRSKKFGDPKWAKAWCLTDRPAIFKAGPMAIPEEIGEKGWNLWQGPSPRTAFRGELVHYNWRFFRGYGTGDLPNNGLHFVDMARWALGADWPERVYAGGGKYFHPGEDFEYEDTQMLNVNFPDGKFLTWEGCSHTGAKPFMDQCTGTLVYLDDGLVNFGPWGDARVFDRSGKKLIQEWAANAVDPAQLAGGINAGAGVGTCDYSHIAKFVDCVRTRSQQTAATIDEAIRSNICTELGNVSLLTGEAIRLDPKTGRLADPKGAAAKFWNRVYEPGWEPRASCSRNSC